MAVRIEGASGRVGRAARHALDRGDAAGSAGPGTRDVTVLATPTSSWSPTGTAGAIVVAPAVTAAEGALADVPDAGWFGGVGGLLAAAAVAKAADPTTVHVSYGLLEAVRAWRAVGPSLRSAVLTGLWAGGTARVDGEEVPEPVAVGRRLAWFPRPVGPAHAAAVPGLEARAITTVPTVRTWVAIGSLRAELLQAIGRTAPDGGLAGWLRRRAGRDLRGPTDRLRWAVVAEVRDGDDVVRAWANGSDPIAAAGAVLGHASARISSSEVAGVRSVVDLAPPGVLLDRLADDRVLRWSVARPVPSAR